LRTATFMVRPRRDRFTFAHRSFMEYFLARHLVTLMDWQDLPDLRLRATFPIRDLNRESTAFLGEILRTQPALTIGRAENFWGWLKFMCEEVPTDSVSGVRSPVECINKFTKSELERR
jgi:hypothetical protein